MRLYNTLTRRVDELRLREPGKVTMYVCGPTVQGPPHFGHARASIVPDVLRRYLEWTGHEVFHVRNITDVEDKIIARAEAEQRPAAAVAEEFTRVWERDIARLGVLPPHVVPRAAGHIPEQIALIRELIEAGAAYPADGNVYFSVRAFPEYGKLSGRDVDELRAGARVEPDERKRDPLDFALWKRVVPPEEGGSPFEPSWESPWGPGRPGWHIECSAMALRYLGDGFDIHAGGIDLAFPHHENEIAQAEAAGHPFARHWVHNGLLNLGEQKMSKSVGNIISLADALDRYGGGVLRLFYLQAHYRSPVEFSEARLDEASAAYDRWRAFLRASADLQPPAQRTPEAQEALARFRAAMEDDLGTPAAHAVLFDLVSAGNAHLAARRWEEAAAVRDVFTELAGVLGYDLSERQAGDELVGPLVEALLELREEARARKDFATADRVRDRLARLGIVVEDSPEGPRWHLGARPARA
ncbi:MAG TPA: cysteine--tRNA ligase [Egibacteraceae bacterium]